MYYEQEKDVSSFVAGVLLGAVIGAGIALVVAPGRPRSTPDGLIEVDIEEISDDDELDRAAILRTLRRRRRKAGR